jgi:hypothetical protein
VEKEEGENQLMAMCLILSEIAPQFYRFKEVQQFALQFLTKMALRCDS